MVFAFFVEVLKIVMNFSENKLLAHWESVNHACEPRNEADICIR